MKNNRLAALGLAIFVLVLCLYFIFRDADDGQTIIVDTPVVNLPETNVNSPLVKINSPRNIVTPQGKVWNSTIIPTQPIGTRVALDEFRNVAKINLPVPPGMEFVKIDFDEDIAGVYGSTRSGDKEFVALAIGKIVDLKQSVNYLEEEAKAFPLIKDVKFDTSKVIDIATSKDSSLSNLQIVEGKKGRETVYVALTERSDRKGSYLFIMRAPTNYYDENDDGLETLLQQLKAQ